MKKWKIIAIVFICLFVVENSILIYDYISSVRKDNLKMTCFYEICEGYADAWLDEKTNLCYCYDYDNLGQLVVSKEKWMK